LSSRQSLGNNVRFVAPGRLWHSLAFFSQRRIGGPLIEIEDLLAGLGPSKDLITAFLTFVVVELLPSATLVVGVGVGMIVRQVGHRLVERVLAANRVFRDRSLRSFSFICFSAYGRFRGVNRTGYYQTKLTWVNQTAIHKAHGD
jgi:hypothetical protein